MNARGRLNPTNGVGGLFTPDLQSSGIGLTSSNFISRARLAAARRAREMKLEGGQQVRVGRLDLNDPPTPVGGIGPTDHFVETCGYPGQEHRDSTKIRTLTSYPQKQSSHVGVRCTTISTLTGPTTSRQDCKPDSIPI
jgi:hypothetical protein